MKQLTRLGVSTGRGPVYPLRGAAVARQWGVFLFGYIFVGDIMYQITIKLRDLSNLLPHFLGLTSQELFRWDLNHLHHTHRQKHVSMSFECFLGPLTGCSTCLFHHFHPIQSPTYLFLNRTTF